MGIERKVLTGRPMRVQRRRAVIRYMFWNADDVKYFQPIDLWTRRGLKGKIEEPSAKRDYSKHSLMGISDKTTLSACLCIKEHFHSKMKLYFVIKIHFDL